MNTTNVNSSTGDFDESNSAPENTSVNTQARVTSEVRIHSPKKTQKAKDAFRTISEVADKLDVQQHVLRFWETKFSQVRPLKRGGGRRYYRPEDIALLERIHNLLYTQGYTIKGVQKLLKEQGKAQIIAQPIEASNGVGVQQRTEQAVGNTAINTQQPEKKAVSASQRAVLEIMLAELKAMRAMIKV